MMDGITFMYEIDHIIAFNCMVKWMNSNNLDENEILKWNWPLW
jgi:hypothetical protein